MGRIPSAAAPVAAPINAVSEIGVSITRSAPNLSSKPPVAPKMPPYLATSSPITNTFSSFCISWAIPSEIAAAIVNSRSAINSFHFLFSFGVRQIHAWWLQKYRDKRFPWQKCMPPERLLLSVPEFECLPIQSCHHPLAAFVVSQLDHSLATY